MNVSGLEAVSSGGVPHTDRNNATSDEDVEPLGDVSFNDDSEHLSPKGRGSGAVS